jgi:hypothetical protein
MSSPESPKEPPPPAHTGQHGEPGEERWQRVRIPGADQGSSRQRPSPAGDNGSEETPVEDPRTHTSGG